MPTPFVRSAHATEPSPRGEPLPEDEGDELIEALLRDMSDEAELAGAIGVDLTPPAPSFEHAPRVYLSLEEWWARSEEVHRFLEDARRKAQQRKGPGGRDP